MKSRIAYERRYTENRSVDAYKARKPLSEITAPARSWFVKYSPNPTWVNSLKVGDLVLRGAIQDGGLSVSPYQPVQRIVKIDSKAVYAASTHPEINERTAYRKPNGIYTYGGDDDYKQDYGIAPLTPDFAVKIMLLDTKDLLKRLQPQKMGLDEALALNKTLQAMLKANPGNFAGASPSLPLDGVLRYVK